MRIERNEADEAYDAADAATAIAAEGDAFGLADDTVAYEEILTEVENPREGVNLFDAKPTKDTVEAVRRLIR